MIVQVFLDKTRGCYTNLDVVSGKVVLRVPNTSTVTSVIVKLEGESKTRLVGVPYNPSSPYYTGREKRQQERPLLEVHKVLYKTQVVWPPAQVQLEVGHKGGFTLNSGQYEWPFEFKIPINNSCDQSFNKNVMIGGLQLEFARPPERHVKQTLPPSLNGFPGEAEIRYFVKVTVNRPQFYKENPRVWNDFTFLPIEPPRIVKEGETYARRQHEFQPDTTSKARKKSLLGSSDTNVSDSAVSATKPRFSVDVRLPNPAVLTCCDDLPLKILIKQLSERKSNVYLQMLQIELIGYTKVRAHELTRTESNVWVIASMSNMAIPIGSPNDPVGTETPINPEYWQGSPLPNNVSPSFTACNISRYYELEVRVGLGYGTYEHGRDQLSVLPLRLPVDIYSGIKPPQGLLDRMASKASAPSKLSSEQPGSSEPISPAAGPSSATVPPSASGIHPPAQSVPGYEEAPPSYEDAIAQDMPPIDGPRRDYAPPPFTGGPDSFPGDNKRR